MTDTEMTPQEAENVKMARIGDAKNNLRICMKRTVLALRDISLGLEADDITADTGAWILSMMADDISTKIDTAIEYGVLG